MKPVFVANIKTFVEDILRPKNLKPKRINGAPLTVRQFGVFLKHYVILMHNEEIPTPERLFEATAKAVNRKIVDDCFEKYNATLLKIVSESPREPASFKVLRGYILENTVNYFWRSKVMGGSTALSIALEDLIKRIDSTEEYFERFNNMAYDKKRFEDMWRSAQKALAAAIPVLAAVACFLLKMRAS